MLKEQTVSYTEHIVQRGSFHISAREYPGEEPTIVLMHGFPDTLHPTIVSFPGSHPRAGS